jgi:predicted 3-demethylubiquinone-9 3-methyltransferase (glyoxalase superfamily)
MQKIHACLWFDHQAVEAMNFYTSVFPDSRVTHVARYGEAGPRPKGSVMTVAADLAGVPFLALNGGPQIKFSEAVSFVVDCADQAEVDHYWEALAADGGETGPCGWLKDRFGVSWQIVPAELPQLIGDPDPARARRATEAMLNMTKLDIAALKRALEG